MSGTNQTGEQAYETLSDEEFLRATEAFVDSPIQYGMRTQEVTPGQDDDDQKEQIEETQARAPVSYDTLEEKLDAEGIPPELLKRLTANDGNGENGEGDEEAEGNEDGETADGDADGASAAGSSGAAANGADGTKKAAGGQSAKRTKANEGQGSASTDAASTAGQTTSKQTAQQDQADGEPLNYEELYKKVMAPFKANGREFAPSSPEEVVRLMQMGANYTKKMQALKPSLKILRTLENNGLLQEDKINFLIDLDKKNPKAIQKYLRDSKVDPLDLDLAEEPDYKPSNHSVSDTDMAFHEALETVTSTPTGTETIKTVNRDWDKLSKEALYREPQLLQIIDEQMANGIYAAITAEMERRRTLGELSNVPFIQAYKTVGDELHSSGKLISQGTSQGSSQTTATGTTTQPVSTRSTRSRGSAVTRDQVRAVSSAPGKPSVRTPFDPFNMTDEEIMRITNPR